MDRIDRDLVRLLHADARMTYHQLGQQVRLSANTVADRVRRLRATGIIRGFRAEIDPAALGRTLTMVSEIRIQDTMARPDFEAGLREIAQLVAGSRLTGEYDYELRLVCRDAAEFETVVDRLRRDHGVLNIRSRMVLHDIAVDTSGLLDLAR